VVTLDYVSGLVHRHKKQRPKIYFDQINEVLVAHAGLSAIGFLTDLTRIKEKIDLTYVKVM
jgi:hypothetical protein